MTALRRPGCRELERQRRKETEARAGVWHTQGLAHSLYNSVISMLIPPAGLRYSPWWMHGHRRIALFIEIQLKLNSFAALVNLRRGWRWRPSPNRCLTLRIREHVSGVRACARVYAPRNSMIFAWWVVRGSIRIRQYRWKLADKRR